MSALSRIEVTSVDGLPEIGPEHDLGTLIAAAYDLRDGDIVVVTSKVVSKVEGRVRAGDREAAIVEETVRLVARRGATSIVRNRIGLTMAAAGIDASNVAAGSIVLLPVDPDASARALRARLAGLTGHNVAVVITDTAGRAWRDGQTDIAIGAAGLRVAESFEGRRDAHGNELAVTLPAVADEIAGAAELAQGKLGGRPTALLRGRADLVLPTGEHGPGASSLIRPEGADLFGWGAREAVIRALRADPADRVPFGVPVGVDELTEVLGRLLGTPVEDPQEGADAATAWLLPPHTDLRAVDAVLFAHGWERVAAGSPAGTPVPDAVVRLIASPICT